MLSADLAAARGEAPHRPTATPGATDPTWPDPREPAHESLHEPAYVSLDPHDDTVIPVPGRHVDRRRAVAGLVDLVDLVPETLRGRARIGAGALAVVAVLVALGLVVTCWWVIRAEPVAEAAPVLGGVPELGGQSLEVAEPAEAATPNPTPMTAAATVTIDVAGRVRRPGIVVLPTGSRVVDALEAAGGARPRVDLSSINLARVLVDGEQILVGSASATASVPETGSDAPAATAPVNLNLADQAELETLPDIGPVTAAAIVAWREQHGAFTALTELLEVDGIGDVTLANLTPHVTL